MPRPIWLPKTITADGIVHTGEATLHAVILTDEGANAATVKVYDNTAASGDKLTPDLLSGGDGVPVGVVGIDCYVNNGIYIDLTTAGTCTVSVYYRPRN